jgi:hypothetical protein
MLRIFWAVSVDDPGLLSHVRPSPLRAHPCSAFDGKPGVRGGDKRKLGKLARRSQLVTSDKVRHLSEIEGEAEALGEGRDD